MRRAKRSRRYTTDSSSARAKSVPSPMRASSATAARSAFLTLLPPDNSAFFLQAAQRREMWPRVRSLFGAPPYCF